MKCKYFHSVFLFAWLLLFCFSCGDSGSSTRNLNNNIQCIAKDREALLQFKQGVEVDHCGLLTSWAGQECCHWHGVRCSNRSGHVIRLDLSGAPYYDPDYNLRCLEGKVSPSLVELKRLKYLDVGYNNFQAQPIPMFIGTLLNLKYLNLSSCNFSGEVPHQLANLSSLTSLDISNIEDTQSLYVRNFRWLSYLTLLKDIILSSVDLSLATDWIQIVNNLPLLRSLQMDQCHLPFRISSSLVYTNSSTTLHFLSLYNNDFEDTRIFQWVSNLTRLSSSFSYLDISWNGFSGPIPSTLGSMPSLTYLDISEQGFEGPIPETFSNLTHLVHLDLSANHFQGSKWNPEVLGSLCSLEVLSLRRQNITNELSTIIQPLSQCVHRSLVSLDIEINHLWGSIPDDMGKFSSLRELVLGQNQLSGTISPSLGLLFSLEYLDLSSNSLKGIFSNHHLSNHSKLTALHLSGNSELVFNISANWVPPFQLDDIDLSSCILGPRFPKWLLTQTNFSYLDISNTEIGDMIPVYFWNSLTSNLEYMNMSGNMIHGNVPDVLISFHGFPRIDLSSNFFHGGVPSFLINASLLFLNDNYFSDLAPFFCPKTKVFLSTLRLSNNKLLGKLPNCWGYFDQLTSLSLDNNKLSGKLPESIGMLTQLQALHLHNNSISGKLPVVHNCSSLSILDLSHNYLTGYIPDWIGYHCTRLVVLNLRNNNFLGDVPSSLCQLSGLHVLDFSTDHFHGFIPKCIWNLTAMANNNFPTSPFSTIDIAYHFSDHSISWHTDYAWIMWKGEEWSLENFLREVIAIDMSNNELEGPIPDGISSLTGLKSIDLSRNRLNGIITPKIGQLTSLEYLDFSRNQLSGEIPTSLSNLNFLQMLDVSYNNLSGRIPHGTQLRGFDATHYTGNPGLCGEPLSTCQDNAPKHDKPTSHENKNEDDDDDDFFLGLCISAVLGFIIGFWGVCGSLVIKKSWRHAFFLFFDDIKDKVYVFVVSKARVLRRNS